MSQGGSVVQARHEQPTLAVHLTRPSIGSAQIVSIRRAGHGFQAVCDRRGRFIVDLTEAAWRAPGWGPSEAACAQAPHQAGEAAQLPHTHAQAPQPHGSKRAFTSAGDTAQEAAVDAVKRPVQRAARAAAPERQAAVPSNGPSAPGPDTAEQAQQGAGSASDAPAAAAPRGSDERDAPAHAQPSGRNNHSMQDAEAPGASAPSTDEPSEGEQPAARAGVLSSTACLARSSIRTRAIALAAAERLVVVHRVTSAAWRGPSGHGSMADRCC